MRASWYGGFCQDEIDETAAKGVALLLCPIAHPLPVVLFAQLLHILGRLLPPDAHCSEEFAAHIRSNLILYTPFAVRVGVHECFDFLAGQAGFYKQVKELEQSDLPSMLVINIE